MKRFTTNTDKQEGNRFLGMVYDDDGDWVSYDDYIEQLEAVKSRVCECTDKNDILDFLRGRRLDYCPYCGGKMVNSEDLVYNEGLIQKGIKEYYEEVQNENLCEIKE